jgi:hypothetical protein
MSQCFAAIYVPDFPVEAILRSEPELREQAVAVMEGTPPLLRVIACNEKAAHAGVETGMTRMQVGACLPDSGIRLRSRAMEISAHAALLDCACAFSPQVEDTAAEAVVLDLAGLERIFGSPAKIACDLAHRCSAMGLEANVAVASNPDAALLAARGFAGVTVIAQGKEAERLSDLPVDVLQGIGSAGMESSPARKRPTRGRQQPTQEVRLEQILETLDRWGVRNLCALAALPEVAITERLGQEGLRLQRLARGAASRPLVPVEPPLEFEEVAELEYPVELLGPLAFVLNRMLEQLCARLEARALSTHELRLRLELEGTDDSPQRRKDAEENISDSRFANSDLSPAGSPAHNPPRRHGDTEKGISDFRFVNSGLRRNGSVSGNQKSKISNQKFSASLRLCGESALHERTLHVPVPMRDAKVFLKLLQLDLKMSPPMAPVQKIWLRAEPVRPRVTQGGLFLPAVPPPEKLELTLARIAAVLNPPQRRRGAEGNISDFQFLSSDCMQTPALSPDQKSAIGIQQSDSASPRLCGESSRTSENQKSEISNQQWLGSPELLDTHRPGAFRMRRFVPPDAVSHDGAMVRNETDQRCGSAKLAPLTALRILRPPVPVAVEVREGRPVRLVCDQHTAFSGKIVWTAGPWRSSGEWWNICDFRSSNSDCGSDAGQVQSIAPQQNMESSWSKEEWDLAVRNGEELVVCRVCRETETGLWMLEGIYD